VRIGASVRDFARTYRALLRVSWEMALEYQAQAFLWILSGVFPLVMMVVWLALVDEAGPISGWDKSDFLAYYISAAVVFELCTSWIVYDWDDDIRNGTLSVKLLKPLDPGHHLLSRDLGWKVFIVFFIVPPVALIAWVSPAIHYPVDPPMFFAFLLSVITGYFLSFIMGSAFAMISFWSTLSGNVYGLWIGIGQFLAGWIAPLSLFPAWFRQIASWLPFRSTLGFPVEILTGQLSWPEIRLGFMVSLGWVLLFLVIYRTLWRVGLRRYEAVGA
jgi:ABC-2 type transport system permease protein